MLQLIDYSERAVCVIGDTKQHKEKMKELNGKFNPYLKCGAGWIFSKKHQTEIEKYINSICISHAIQEDKKEPLKPILKPSNKIKRNNHRIGVPKEAIKYLSSQPQNLEEAVLHFFLNGGKIKTSQFIKELGYKSYKDIKPFFGFYSNNGTCFDLLPENSLFDGFMYSNVTGRDFIDSVVNIIIINPGKSCMADRLIKLNETNVPF